MRHRLPGALLLALLAAGVTGCSDDPEPDVADPTSNTSSPTPSSSAPTSDPPTTTATADPEPESAEAFLRRWQKASDSMQLTGDTAEYLSLGPDCKPCNETAGTVERYYSAGGYIRFEGTKIRRISKVGSSQQAPEFDLARSTAPTTYKESSTGPVKSFPGGESTFRVRLKMVGDRWVVLYYSQLAS